MARPHHPAGSKPRVMVPEREAEARRLAAEGVGLAAASKAMGIDRKTLTRWAKRAGCEFVPAARFSFSRFDAERPAEAYAARLKGSRNSAAANRLPLTDAERRRYVALRQKGYHCGVRVTREEALAHARGQP